VPTTHPRYPSPVPLPENGPISWHDGQIVSYGFTRELSAQGSNDFVLLADIYPIFEFPHPSDLKRLRYKIRGLDVLRFSFTGDLQLLKKHASAGNIDHMRLDFETTGDILNLYLFGGFMSVEAASFEISEIQIEKLTGTMSATQEKT
jgi:hypothetical protein